MKAVRVEGTSMWPVLKTGDLVLVDTDEREPRVGDIVLRTISDSPIVHRVLSGEITKGDRFSECDPGSGSRSRIGEVVIGVIPRRLALQAGWSPANLRPPFDRLIGIQTRLSHAQARAESARARRALLAGLMVNGWMIRSLYYFMKRGK